MMKVKVIAARDAEELTETTNNFLESIKDIAINIFPPQYSSINIKSGYMTIYTYSCLVAYIVI